MDITWVLMNMLNEKIIENSVVYRNESWRTNSLIPSWVDIKNVGLDQFFTNDRIADKYYTSFITYLLSQNKKIDDFSFIEPSAGSGSFFNLLPTGSIGLDVCPLGEGIIKQDFLSWKPDDSKKSIIFIGNPPFGYRGWLALSFMNHAAKFAEYIAFILPMSFQSEGKGSPKNRVKGMTLVHSEIVETDSFHEPDGKIRKVNALWQIWKKGSPDESEQSPRCSSWVDLFTVDLRKERLCGQKKIDFADFFLQRTFYNTPPSLVKSFSEVRYVCGYGLIIKKNKDDVIDALNSVDWTSYSNLAAHNCRHISMYHIEKALTDKGFVDV
jgi:hypothetical protein